MHHLKSSAFAACALFAAAGPCAAWADDASPPASAPKAVATTASPYQVNLLYTGEVWDNASGGIKRGTMYMQNIDAALDVDTDKAFGWTGGRFHFEAFYATSRSLNDQYVGAVDVQSSIDTTGPTMLRLYQVYYDQTFDNTDVLFGIYDLETEFGNTKPELLFLSKNYTWNTAYDMSGTMASNGLLGPGNYPYTPLALRVRHTFDSAWSVQAAIADAAGDNPKHPSTNSISISQQYGATGIAEVDYTPTRYTKLMAGIWGLTSLLPEYSAASAMTPREKWDEAGAYVGGATRLYSAGGLRGLYGFFTLGAGTQEVTNTNLSGNAGLTYTGLFDARPHDKAGIAIAVNNVSPGYRQWQIAQGSGAYGQETSFELTYRAALNDWVTLQPDVQYIIHPGYAPNLKNDLVFGLHFEIGHLFDL